MDLRVTHDIDPGLAHGSNSRQEAWVLTPYSSSSAVTTPISIALTPIATPGIYTVAIEANYWVDDLTAPPINSELVEFDIVVACNVDVDFVKECLEEGEAGDIMICLGVPNVAVADCDTERLIYEAVYGPDQVDSDLDGLSNELEVRYLETSPCLVDTDADGVDDGPDAMPTISNLGSGVPLDVQVVSVNQIKYPDGCDDGTTWDPFFDGFSFAVPELGLYTPNLEAIGWSRVDHVMNRPNSNSDIELLDASGTGFKAAGNAINFDLNPDLSLWGGDLFPKLNLRFAGMIIDDDKHYDDSMAFETVNNDVLFELPRGITLTSSMAADADGGNIHCQAEIFLSTKLEVADKVLNAYNALQSSGGPSGNPMQPAARCASINNCITTPPAPPISNPSPTVPYGGGTAGEPCDDPLIWHPNAALELVVVWSPGCEGTED